MEGMIYSLLTEEEKVKENQEVLADETDTIKTDNDYIEAVNL